VKIWTADTNVAPTDFSHGLQGTLPKPLKDNPLLSKEGKARSARVVCSQTRSDLIDAREALPVNRYCSSLNRPPQPSLREGIPALLRRGMGAAPFEQHIADLGATLRGSVRSVVCF